MSATRRLVIADGLVKAALLEPGTASLLSYLGGGLGSGAGQKLQGGTWEDAGRMGGRTFAEGLGGGVAGGLAGSGLGALIAALAHKNPAAGAMIGGGMGAGLGSVGGTMHGAYRAAQTAKERHHQKSAAARLVIASGLVKRALANAGNAALLWGLGGPAVSGLGHKLSGGTWGDSGRIAGRSMAEGAAGAAGGGLAGGGIGALIAALLRKSPSEGAALGAGLGAMGGNAVGQFHGEMRAKQDIAGSALSRHRLVQQVLHALGR